MAKEHDWDVCYGLKPYSTLLSDHGLKAVAIIGLDQKAIAVAGVCSCDHENSNVYSSMEFSLVYRWLQEQTPATAFLNQL